MNEKTINQCDFIALNQQQLSRFSYHWLKGLAIKKEGERTLFDEALRLENDPFEVTRLKEQEEFLSRQLWLIQLIFWIFNINRYRENYYHLYSYYSYTHYIEGYKKMNIEDQKKAIAIGGFLTLVGGILIHRSQWFQRIINPYLPVNLQKKPAFTLDENELFYMNVTSYSSIQNDFTSSHNRTEEEHISDIENHGNDNFLVIAAMQPLLMILNIHAPLGTYYSLTSLKKAYRQCLIKTHPDKTGRDSSQELIAVMDVYKQILQLINEKNSLFELLEKELEAWKILRKNIDQCNRKVNEYCQHADDYIASVHEVKKSVHELNVEVRQIRNLVAETSKQITQESSEIQKVKRALDLWIAQRATDCTDFDKSPSTSENVISFFSPKMNEPEIKISETNTISRVDSACKY